jgi:hypothetical protein
LEIITLGMLFFSIEWREMVFEKSIFLVENGFSYYRPSYVRNYIQSEVITFIKRNVW